MLPFLLLAVLAPLAAMAVPTDGIAKTSRRTLREEAVGAFNDLAQQSGLEPVLSRATGKPVQDLFQKLLAQVPDADLQALRDARSKWCDNGGAAFCERGHYRRVDTIVFYERGHYRSQVKCVKTHIKKGGTGWNRVGTESPEALKMHNGPRGLRG